MRTLKMIGDFGCGPHSGSLRTDNRAPTYNEKAASATVNNALRTLNIQANEL